MYSLNHYWYISLNFVVVAVQNKPIPEPSPERMEISSDYESGQGIYINLNGYLVYARLSLSGKYLSWYMIIEFYRYR